MKLTVTHQLRIALPDSPARAIAHLLLTPKDSPTQKVGKWTITLPEESEAVGFFDAFGNRAQMLAEARPPEEWTITAAGTVETMEGTGVLGRLPGEPMPRIYLRRTPLAEPLSNLVESLAEQAKGSDRIGLLHALMAATPAGLRAKRKADDKRARDEALAAAKTAAVEAKIDDGGAEPQVQMQVQVQPPIEDGRMPSADLAHAFVGTARALGIPARYVTGYMVPESKGTPGFHAWAEAYDEGLGWIGFDPSLQVCPAERHIRIACGLDADSAAPVRSFPGDGPRLPAKVTVTVED